MAIDLEPFFRCMYHGAALVYHKVLAVQVDVKQWEANNPQLTTYLQEAVDAGNMFLEAHGVEVLKAENAAVVAATAVLASLKQMAAMDASVNSHASTEPVARVAPAEAAVEAAPEPVMDSPVVEQIPVAAVAAVAAVAELPAADTTTALQDLRANLPS